MSIMSASVRMNMAAMAQVLRAQRVWSIHVEKDTSLLGNTYNIEKSNLSHTSNPFTDKMCVVISGLAQQYRNAQLLSVTSSLVITVL